MFTFDVPPPQPLNQAAVFIIHTNFPFACSNLDVTFIFRKMELGQKDLGGFLRRARFMSMKLESENTISKIKSIIDDLPYCRNW